jgi:hypothetical protein
MTPEAMKIAIATALGWTNVRRATILKGRIMREGLWGCPPEWEKAGYTCNELVPNYTGSLDAMHEAEKVLTKVQAMEYAMALEDIVGAESDEEGHPYPEIFKFIRATALQRATAFLAVVASTTASSAVEGRGEGC